MQRPAPTRDWRPLAPEEQGHTHASGTAPQPDIGAPPRISIGNRLAEMPTHSAGNGVTARREKAPDEDALERKADDAAAIALRGAPGAPPPGIPRPARAADPARRGGSPLPPQVRAFFEPRFGADFSHVRVHADGAAARETGAMGAHAFAKGGDIVFGAGRFDPGSSAGMDLLAHELAHVVQQSETGERLQRRDKDEKPKGVSIPFAVKVTKPLSSVELLVEVGRQYAAAAPDAETAKRRATIPWQWVGDPMVASDADVRKGYVIVPIRDTSIEAGSPEEQKARDKFAASLSAEDRAQIDSAAYKEFWDKTQYKVGEKLGNSADDKRFRGTLDTIRDNLLRKREAIDALPPEIKNFIFDPEARSAIEPKDYDTALRIAQKISELTPTELAEYKSRTNARTTDWSVYESSIDRFLTERAERAQVTNERREVETRLFNMDALYDRYRQYMSMLKTSTSNAMAGAHGGPGAAMGVGASIGAQPTLNKMRAELDADLITAGFPGGISDFEALIKRYEAAFEKETLALAKVMLDQYAHTLWKEEERYGAAGSTDTLHQALEASGARADYETGDKIRDEHAQMPMTLEEMQDQAYWVGKRNEARASGASKVGAAGAGHPLIQQRDFDREAMARATTPGQRRQQMLDYVAARKKDIETTRKALEEKPTMIYGLDQLLATSFKAQNIQGGSIRDRIIRDHISDVHWVEAIPQIILAVVAIAAGLVTGGGGTVAVLGAGTALGIGAYQALEEFRRYELKSAAYGAQLSSDDPTIAWVVVAVIGAGFDAAALASALPKLRPAIQAFEAGAEANDVAKLTAKLNDVEEGIRNTIVRAAEARAEAREAWKAILRPPAGLRMVIFPGAEEFGRLIYAVYLTAKQGIRDFQVFVKSNEAIALIGDIGKLSAEDLALLKTGYLQAVADMESVAAHAKTLGLDAAQTEGFLKLWARTKNGSLSQTKAEMDVFAASKQGGLPSPALNKQSLIVDENVVIAQQKRAAGTPLQAGEAAALKRIDAAGGAELRVPKVVGTKSAGAGTETFDIVVPRDSQPYKDMITELERLAVGRTKGVEDRGIVADVFFAKTEPGVTPTLATHDTGIYNRLLVASGKDPAKLGKSVPEAFPNGFPVTIQGRTINVLPLPKK